MASALIVFASLTGSTEECADFVAEALENHGVTVDIKDSLQATANDFENYDICIVGSYTYGDGEIPDEILDFYEELPTIDLSNKVFGVFGSGDTYYEYFCNAVILFEEQFNKTGAKKGSQSVKIELNAEDDDIENLHHFAKELVEALN